MQDSLIGRWLENPVLNRSFVGQGFKPSSLVVIKVSVLLSARADVNAHNHHGDLALASLFSKQLTCIYYMSIYRYKQHIFGFVSCIC